jgi:hypothetical protein
VLFAASYVALQAEERNKPNEGRVILHMAHSFVEELAPMNPQFDRLAFIGAATGPDSHDLHMA